MGLPYMKHKWKKYYILATRVIIQTNMTSACQVKIFSKFNDFSKKKEYQILSHF